MELMDVSKLIPHPRNSEFFDDMVGEPWTAFLESIKTSGVIEPIIATQDLVIVSGHQRIRACKELGIKEVLVDVRVFDSEDEILKQLIETNIRQRGIGNPNAVKLGRCIKELERIFGIAHGNNQHTDRSGNNFQSSKTQDDLAAEFEMSKRQMANYKSLTTLIPELQDAVQTGKITATTAMGLVKQLNKEEQEQLADMIVDKEKLTNREVEFYKRRVQELNLENIKLNKENSDLKEREPEVIEKKVEVVPEDYEKLKQTAKQVSAYKTDLATEKQKLADRNRKILELEDQISELSSRTASGELHTRVVEGALYFIGGCGNFVRDYGGYIWLTDHLDELSETELKNYEWAVRNVYAWAQKFLEAIENGKNNLLEEK